MKRRPSGAAGLQIELLLRAAKAVPTPRIRKSLLIGVPTRLNSLYGTDLGAGGAQTWGAARLCAPSATCFGALLVAARPMFTDQRIKTAKALHQRP